MGLTIIAWILFGAFVGWVASIIMRTNQEQGAVANIIIGIIGAFIGGVISKALGGTGIEAGLDLSSILFGILGAVILIFFIRALTGSKNSAVHR